MVILTNFPPPTEGIRHQQDNTAAVIDQKELGNGTIFIAESRLSWRGVDGSGFSLEYKSINLHAVSRDLSAFRSECLYLMLDGKILEDEEMPANGNGNESDESEEENAITELRFVPSDKGALSAMYQAMKECQLLHPDPQSTDSEAEEEESEFYNTADGLDHLTTHGTATLQHIDSILEAGQGDAQQQRSNGNTEPMDQGQFDDAEMEG
ncbi:hypothetical protein SNE40_000720 [Patella caerulea]|uniref:Methylosome subunit pICln n=1 Tax=Patella caerulea TaxID=87958 RepID=A0AAN8QAC0_PATCE